MNLTIHYRKNSYPTPFRLSDLTCFKSRVFAVSTGVGPAPYAVTGRHLNRLTYTPFIFAGVARFEHAWKQSKLGFGDRCLTIEAILLFCTSFLTDTFSANRLHVDRKGVKPLTS